MVEGKQRQANPGPPNRKFGNGIFPPCRLADGSAGAISRFEPKLAFSLGRPSSPVTHWSKLPLRSMHPGLGRDIHCRPPVAAKTTEGKNAMTAFLKSDLFLRFLGGFAIGAIGVFILQPDDDHSALTSPAMAASASATPASTADNAAL
ncbi:hypothetical protein CAF53_11655 [Sphingobium sp. LB126]|nr:hypothetical protein CAF53_11655 [Sphingobium sp. LB126]